MIIEIIGSKPTEPIHFRFEKLNNKICLSAIQTDNVSGDNDNRLKTAIALSNMDAILQAFDISAYNNDSTAVVFESTDLFKSNKELTPARGVISTLKEKKEACSLGKVKVFDDNISLEVSQTFDALLESYLVTFPMGEVATTSTISLLLLPGKKMQPRILDSRVGVFPNYHWVGGLFMPLQIVTVYETLLFPIVGD